MAQLAEAVDIGTEWNLKKCGKQVGEIGGNG